MIVSQEEQVTTPPTSLANEETSYSSFSYLIVDDEPFVRNLTTLVLKKIGCSQISTSTNGHDALDALKKTTSPFDVIICDLNMPEMDGIELMRHAAEMNFQNGIIYLSGQDDRLLATAYDLARSHKLNVLGVLPKPLNEEQLVRLLKSYQPATTNDVARIQEPITESELRQGLSGPGVSLVFQPKVDIASGKIFGVESLSRWHHPTRGLLGPDTFIPLAEACGLIDEMTMLIFAQAMRQTRAWQQLGIRLKMSVNISANTLTYPGLVEALINCAKNNAINNESIVLELTESQIMKNVMGCQETLMRLRMKNFGLSIDDFGTGHSSMAQLKKIPFTELKIDRAFVTGAATDAPARAILESSVLLARNLGMETVAEGVESREDWDQVVKLGCDSVQGYYCARPMAGDDLTTFIRQWVGPHPVGPHPVGPHDPGHA